LKHAFGARIEFFFNYNPEPVRLNLPPETKFIRLSQALPKDDYSPSKSVDCLFRAAQSIPRRINVRIGATSNSAAV
jgi:hypothetical protein